MSLIRKSIKKKKKKNIQWFVSHRPNPYILSLHVLEKICKSQSFVVVHIPTDMESVKKNPIA